MLFQRNLKTVCRFMNGYAAVEINGKMYLVNEKIDICSEEFDGDMLFYNIQKHCYVVIEIKTRAFDPGDMGQLGTYIAATDDLLIFNNSIEQEYQNLYNTGTLTGHELEK